MEASEFQDHRKRVCDIFKGSNIPEGTLIYFGGEQPKEPFTDSDLQFYQESLFFWLTGWEKADAAIVIDIATYKSTLLIPRYDDHYQTWVGPIPTKESIIQRTGVEAVDFIDTIFNHVKKPHFCIENTRSFPNSDRCSFMHACSLARAVKSDAELHCLRKACEMTGKSIMKVWEEVEPGMVEKEIASIFSYTGARNGCYENSFVTIVASGKNSVCLHYCENSSVIKDGDLVLLDCGLYYEHYAGDVTRTFPANGVFSPDQKLVYNLLLDLQVSLVETVRPSINMVILNQLMFQGIFEIIKKLEIVPKDAKFNRNIALLFCPHSLSHHLGVNTHDVVNLREETAIEVDLPRPCPLVPGNVITIEPGIYFHEVKFNEQRENPEYAIVDFEKALHYAQTVGGIRIEDDVIVTENGSEYCAIIPKTVEEIESIMAAGKAKRSA